MPLEILHLIFPPSKDSDTYLLFCIRRIFKTKANDVDMVRGQFWFLKTRIAFRCSTVDKDIPLWNELDEWSLVLLFFLFHLRLTSNCDSCYESAERKIKFFILTRFCLLLVSWNSSIAIDLECLLWWRHKVKNLWFY